MHLWVIIKIDCACSSLFTCITVDNVNTVWTCVYLIQQWQGVDRQHDRREEEEMERSHHVNKHDSQQSPGVENNQNAFQ